MTAPAVWPDCASKEFVSTLNSAIASDGGEKPTRRSETMFGAPSSVKSLPPLTPFATTPPRFALSPGREKWRSEVSEMPGAMRLSM